MSQQAISKIVKMLEDERIERQCAAAMVLTELRVKDAKAVERLCGCLEQENTTLQLYALEALTAMHAKKISHALSPLLDSPDEEINSRAAALLAVQGSRSGAALAKELDGAPPVRQRAIIGIMARKHNKDTFERLLGFLPAPEVGESVLNTLRGEIDSMTAAEQKTLRSAVSKLLKKKSWLEDESGTARAVRLLGYFRDAELVPILLPFAKPKKNPMPVRMAALAALRRPLKAKKTTAAVLKTLIKYADDEDGTFARSAIETLRGLPLGAPVVEPLTELSHGRHGDARRFAVEALARSGDPKVVKTLIAHLDGDDPVTRDAAGRALSRMDDAAQSLVKELKKATDDPERLTRLCRMLLPHATELKPAARRAIAELAVAALEKGKLSAGPLLELLRMADSDGYAELMTDKALRLKRNKHYDQAFALLCRLDDVGLLDDDSRFAALVSGLGRSGSKKDLGRASRTTDPVLRQAVTLVREGFPVASRLKREKSLPPEALFFLGFNFAESKDEEEKEFGGEVLGYLVSKSPRSKLGRSARNKMRLVGLE